MAPDQLTAGKSGKPHDHAAGLPPLGLSPEWSDWPLALSDSPVADFRMQREGTGPFQFERWVCCHTPSGKGRTIPEKPFPTRNSEKLARVSIGWHDPCQPSSRLGQHHRGTGATIHNLRMRMPPPFHFIRYSNKPRAHTKPALETTRSWRESTCFTHGHSRRQTGFLACLRRPSCLSARLAGTARLPPSGAREPWPLKPLV